MELPHLLLSICLGLGLSACCGFRVFVPLLVSNVAALAGWHHFGEGFEWMGSWTAFYMLLTATLLETGAYYIPWLDNVLDHLAFPVACLAGTLLATSAFSPGLSPLFKWGLGIMLGGGSAGLIHAGIGLLRMGSSAATGGIANSVLATGENISALAGTVMAMLVPVLAALGVLCLTGWLIMRRLKNSSKT